jgi:hypothetical protein
MWEVAQPPFESEQEHEEGDPAPCPEDEEVFVRPDAAGMEEAIGKFMDGMEGHERSGFQEMHRFLAKLPVPATKGSRGMTHAEAIDGKFLPDLDDEQRKRSTLSELIMYKHAKNTGTLRDIQVCNITYLYIPLYTFGCPDGLTLS